MYFNFNTYRAKLIQDEGENNFLVVFFILISGFLDLLLRNFIKGLSIFAYFPVFQLIIYSFFSLSN